MSLRKDLLFELEKADARTHLAAIKAQLATPPARRTPPAPVEAICPACAGSGEGQHDGTVCRSCRGAGTFAPRDTFLDSPDRLPEE